MKLSDALPYEFLGGEYTESKAYALRDEAVAARFHAGEHPWPGRERYVSVWVRLTDGRAVGWNENPSRGWSFPVLSAKKLEQNNV
jgi:hypothetical protein